MEAWPEEAARELEAELKRLDLDGETKRVQLERAQAEYNAVTAEQATMRGLLDWIRKRHPQQAAEPISDADSMAEDSRDIGSIVRHAADTVTEVVPAPVQPAEAESPTQADLCKRELRQLGHDAETAEIRRRLEQAGYKFSQSQVRSSLKYLARKKNPEVESVRPGVWRLLSAPEYVPLESANVPAMNGAGGSP